MRVLFHWTPCRNIPSMRRLGISPAFSRGRTKAVFAVVGRRIGWALDHVRKSHRLTSRCQLALLRLFVPDEQCRRTPTNGVIRVPSIIDTWEIVE